MIKQYEKKVLYWMKNDKAVYIGIWTILAFGLGDFLNNLIMRITNTDSFICTTIIGVLSIMITWSVAAELFEKR